VVLADSGYDDKKIEQAIAHKGWNFIIALGKTRSVKSTALSLSTPKSHNWYHVDTFFRRHQAQVGHRSSTDEWEQTQANGPSHPTHHGLLAPCGQGRAGVF
jgi:hypothetical protein